MSFQYYWSAFLSISWRTRYQINSQHSPEMINDILMTQLVVHMYFRLCICWPIWKIWWFWQGPQSLQVIIKALKLTNLLNVLIYRNKLGENAVLVEVLNEEHQNVVINVTIVRLTNYKMMSLLLTLLGSRRCDGRPWACLVVEWSQRY